MSAEIVIRDAVHGDVRLSAEEARLLDTREMQRLRGIHQLGLAYLVFPGARHSRFEHSIGTMHMAARMIEAIERNARRNPGICRGITPKERRLIRAAALVHDVTHIPFGHNIEDQTGLLPRHDEPARFQAALSPETEIGGELEAQGLREGVLSILGAGGPPLPPFLGQMISDTICSDLMDYLERDARYTGLNLRYDPRIADYFLVDPVSERLFVDCAKAGLLREDIVSEILRMLQARYFFSERVYYHHAKIAAGAMVARAVETALEHGWIRAEDLTALGDQDFLYRLRRSLPGGGRGDECSGDDHEASLRVEEILDRLARRRLFKRVAVFSYGENRDVQETLVRRFFDPGSREARRAFEEAREREFRERFGRGVQVLFYCPNRSMQLKEVGTLVRMPGSDELLPLSSFRDRLPGIGDLETSYLRLWKAYCLASATSIEERRFLQERVRAALPEARDGFRLS